MNFLESLKNLTILSIGPREVAQASGYLRKFSDEELTLADASGLSIMAREKISLCWSTDSHLGLTGVPLVIHNP